MKDLVYRLFIYNSPLQGYVAHLVHGAFTALCTLMLSPVLGAIWAIGFIVFELRQGRDERDKPSEDLAGWLVGMVLASIGYWWLK